MAPANVMDTCWTFIKDDYMENVSLGGDYQALSSIQLPQSHLSCQWVTTWR